MNSRLLLFAVMLTVLAVTGAAANRIAAPVWSAMQAREPALQLPASASAGPSVALALLGGFRSLAADGLWIQLHATWEKRDWPAADGLVRLVPALDPRAVYFWLNGARIMAYDFPAWRIEAGGGYQIMPAEEQQRIVRDQAQRALAHLSSATAYHPASAELWIERASIELNRLRDVPAAAESYRRAAETPGAPHYAARLHAEMLRRSGRPADALAWLVRLHPTLPAGDETAGVELVLARIRELERQLGTPPERAYPAR